MPSPGGASRSPLPPHCHRPPRTLVALPRSPAPPLVLRPVAPASGPVARARAPDRRPEGARTVYALPVRLANTTTLSG